MALLPTGVTAPTTGHPTIHNQIHQKLNNQWVDVKADFGAAGNGATDDTTAIENAFAASTTIFLPPGTYRLTSPLDVTTSGVEIVGAGPGLTTLLIDFAGTANSDTSAIRIKGTVPAYASPTTTLSANATVDPDNATTSRTITVTSAASLAVGDVILIGDSFADSWDNAGWANRRRGELNRIESIVSTTVTLRQPVRYAYTTANTAAVWKPTLLTGCAVRDLTIRAANQGSGWAHGIWAEAVRDFRVDNVELRDLDNRGVSLDVAYGARVTKVVGRDFSDDGGNDRYGYGIVVGGVEDVICAELKFQRVRHSVTTVGRASHVGYAHNVRFSSCIATQCSSSGFDTHPWANDVTFVDCHAAYNTDQGFMIRSGRTDLIGCTDRRNGGPGVTVYGKQAVDVTIRGHKTVESYGTATGAVTFDGTTGDGDPNGVTVTNCEFVRSRKWGVYVSRATGKLRLLNNFFVDCDGFDAASSKQAIHIDTSVALDGAWIVGNLANAVNNVVQVATAQVNCVLLNNTLTAGVGTSPGAVKGTAGTGTVIGTNSTTGTNTTV